MSASIADQIGRKVREGTARLTEDQRAKLEAAAARTPAAARRPAPTARRAEQQPFRAADALRLRDGTARLDRDQRAKLETVLDAHKQKVGVAGEVARLAAADKLRGYEGPYAKRVDAAVKAQSAAEKAAIMAGVPRYLIELRCAQWDNSQKVNKRKRDEALAAAREWRIAAGITVPA